MTPGVSASVDRSPLRTSGLAVNLSLAMAVSTFGSYAVGATAPTLRSSLGISSVHVGWLATSFLLSGAMFSTFVGRRVGAYGSYRSMVALYVLSAVSCLAAASVPSLAYLLLVMFVWGITGAASNPLTNQVLAEQTSAGKRGVLLGIKQSGVQVGLFLTGATLPAIAVAAGWRTAFAVMTVVPVTGLVLTFFTIPRTSGHVGGHARPAALGLLREHRVLVWLFAYALLMGASMSSTITFLPLYTFDVLGFSHPLAGAAISTIGIMGIGARVLSGRLVEVRGTKLRRDLLTVSTGSMIAAIAFMAAATVGGWAIWVGVALVGGVTSTWNVVVMMALIRDLPRHLAAPSTGVVQFGFYIGLMTGPLTFGTLTDVWGSYQAGWLGVLAGFLGATSVVLIWSVRSRHVDDPWAVGH